MGPRCVVASAGSEEASIVAGDFNAVPWERISWHAMRIGGLLDPRVGRGLYPTYNALAEGDLRAAYYEQKRTELGGRDAVSLIGDFQGRPVR